MQVGDYAGGSLPNVVSFAFDKIPPPSQVYVQRDDLLVVTVQNLGNLPDSVTVTVRILEPVGAAAGQPSAPHGPGAPSPFTTRPGYVQVIQRVLRTGALAADAQLVIPLMEGYLLSIGAIATNAQTPGVMFVTGYIGRFANAPFLPTPSLPLFADYCTSDIPCGWPIIPQRQRTPNQGSFGEFTVAAPAAGADWTYSSPANCRMRVDSVIATLTTAVAVANRDVTIQVTDLVGNVVSQVDAGIAHAASLAWTYAAARGVQVLNDTALAATVVLALPAVDLWQGAHLRSHTVGLAAADQWSSVRLVGEQWMR